MINIEFQLSKRAAEIIQERGQAINYLNINAALNQAAREFKRRGRKEDDLKRIIRGIIC
ncbi:MULTISPECIES: hypothetical protein [Bacteria]|uniref:hypothetical protein n=1 Tax=Bacteria TaxID=2 RepID=UPI001361F1D0|nr:MULTISPECIES: hypothetical protein [Bacteria]MZK53338.1 hypothetical protein [Clostridium beijerinckii]MZK61443.1 hypothetical protein [Clostridium beijerinckii]MZK71685.1 hypothetical protein [Clostridium beijerinckii]MZK77078.1 hypothetical protein [Clostridium beijerinckii]MZK86733.1 hypothetical protein [Clostridium beijerinckii]